MADAACAALESAGIRCWIAPRDIPPGEDWSGAIIRAIDQSKVMVLIFSSNANVSTEIPREVRRAANRIRIVTVRIDRAEPAEALEYYLGTVQWFDALPPPVENHLQRLARDIRAILEPPAVKKGEPISKEGVGQQVRKERRQRRRMSLRQLAFVISVTAAILLMLVLGQIFVPSSLKLAVINANGEVLARDLSDNTIGPAVKLTGPSLFEGSDDRYVLASGNFMYVVTESGEVLPHEITGTTVSPSSELSGSLFGGADTRDVLSGGSCDFIFVVNIRGEVWGHSISSSSVGEGFRLNGPSLFEGPNDKYFVFDIDGANRRILVMNTAGEVWAHDLSRIANTECGFDGIGAGYKLSGPGLFGAPNHIYVLSGLYVVNTSGDKYVLSGLYVVNASGDVWRHSTTHSAVGSGVKLNGPTLFGAPNDKYKYFVTYRLTGWKQWAGLRLRSVQSW